MIWKLSRWSGKFADDLESFQMVWKVCGWSGKIPDGLESFRMVWKVSGWSGKFPDGLEMIMMFMSRKRFTHFLTHLSGKRFTRSARQVFAR